MLVKKTIEEQITLIEADPMMTVLEVTKHGNFICFDARHLDRYPWIDDQNSVKSDKTTREHILTAETWKKYLPKLREKGVID
jgi:hypothetical protein